MDGTARSSPVELVDLYQQVLDGRGRDGPARERLGRFFGSVLPGVEDVEYALREPSPGGDPEELCGRLYAKDGRLDADVKEQYNDHAEEIQAAGRYVVPRTDPVFSDAEYGVTDALDVACLTAGVSAVRITGARELVAGRTPQEQVATYHGMGWAALVHKTMIELGESPADDFFR